VIGGGKVALRKCLHFSGADITVVADSILPDIESISKRTIRKRVTPSEVYGMMKDFNMIVTATDDPLLNAEIKDEAIRLGLYANSAHGGGNVVMPSVLRRNDYTVSVSTDGKVPAFPPFVVKELETFLDESFDNMFAVLSRSRELCAGKGTQPERSEFLRRVYGDREVKDLAGKGDIKAAMERVKELGVPR